MLGEEVGHLGLDRLGQQGARPVAQHLGERVGERPWLKQLDDVSIGHGVSTPLLEKWRLEHPHDTPPSSVSPSPTSAHSPSAGCKANIARAKELMAAPMPQVEPPSVRDTADPHAMPDHRPPCPCCG